MLYEVIDSREVDQSAGLFSDETIKLIGPLTSQKYPDSLRLVVYEDFSINTVYRFLSNNFKLEALTIAELYRERWQIELFFKWIKQHLRIKKFYGTSENAVKSQIWIAVSVYVLVAIVKKRLNLDASLYTLLQIFSLTLFEKMPIQQAFAGNDYIPEQGNNSNQMYLFAF